MPFVSDMFTSLGSEPVVVASTLAAYVLSRIAFGTRFPPIVPALAVGVTFAGLTGRFGESLPGFALPEPIVITPHFSIEA